MTITTGMIVTLITIASPLFVGAFALWSRIENKFKEHDAATALRVKAVADEHKETQRRLSELEKSTVTKEDYIIDRAATDRAIENIALSLRDGLSTVTGRIDLVLFEIGRQRNNGKQE